MFVVLWYNVCSTVVITQEYKWCLAVLWSPVSSQLMTWDCYWFPIYVGITECPWFNQLLYIACGLRILTLLMKIQMINSLYGSSMIPSWWSKSATNLPLILLTGSQHLQCMLYVHYWPGSVNLWCRTRYWRNIQTWLNMSNRHNLGSYYYD